MTPAFQLRRLLSKCRVLACLLFIFSGQLFAHNPITSWATAQLHADRLEITLTLATESAWLFLGESPDTAPNIQGSLPRLQAKTAEAYQLSIGKRILAPRETSVVMHEDDAVQLHLIFNRPEAGPVRFDALYLLRLPADHRTSLTVVDATDNVIRGELLNATKHAVDITLPAPELATPPAPAIATPTTATPPATTTPAPKPTVSFLDFLKLGIEHILTGYDHLLFLLGLLVVCRRISSMMVIVTCFTLAHSLTLALAALNVVSIPSRIVEPLIAASIIFVGVENLVRHGEPKGRWLLTFAFGLIHGFGFASVLREVGLGAGGASLFVPLFSFNLGVEIGQLAVVAVGLPLLWFLRTRPVFARHGEAAISFVVLLLGAYWLWQRTIA